MIQNRPFGVDVRLAAILGLISKIPGLPEDAACVLQLGIVALWDRRIAGRYCEAARGGAQ